MTPGASAVEVPSKRPGGRPPPTEPTLGQIRPTTHGEWASRRADDR